MRNSVAIVFGAAGIASLLLAPNSFAANSTSTSAGGANVSIVTGDNGGTTVIVDSDKHCRVSQESGSAARSTSSSATSSGSSHSTTITTGAGGLSGSTTVGSGAPSISMNSGGGSVSGTMSGTSGSHTVSSSANAAGPNECVVILRAPK